MKYLGVMFLAAALSACSFFKSAPTLAQDEIDCLKAGVAEAVAAAVPDATLALAGSNPSSQLATLALKVGEDVTACAVAAVVKDLSATAVASADAGVPSGASGFMTMTSPAPNVNASVVMSGNAYLATAKKKPKL